MSCWLSGADVLQWQIRVEVVGSFSKIGLSGTGAGCPLPI
jgi:hypothetical protein